MKFELTNYCEIDKYASQSYSLIHDVDPKLNLGDISLVDTAKIEDFDLLVGGSPCQDFSPAGNKQGAYWTCTKCNHRYNPLETHHSKRDKCPKCGSTEIEKTRSSLIIEYLRFVREKKPKFICYENVKNILGVQFIDSFNLFIKELEEDYEVHYKVLNSKFYGIPQNRERVILVGIRKDIAHGYTYPEKLEKITTINDIVQKRVSKKYYLDKTKTEPLVWELIDSNKIPQNEHPNLKMVTLLGEEGYEQGRRVYSSLGPAPTLTTRSGIVKIIERNREQIRNSIHENIPFDISEFKTLLNNSKNNISYETIAKTTETYIDDVINWFEDEKIVVDPYVWFTLKDLLKITEDKFDEGIISLITSKEEEEEKTSVYTGEYRTDTHFQLRKGNVAGTLRTIDSCGCKIILEPTFPICCASRGRNEFNSRVAGLPTKQRLELNTNYTSNTLTTVQKDNYILEKDTQSGQPFICPLIKIFLNYFRQNNYLPKYFNIKSNREFIFGENPAHLYIINDDIIEMIKDSGYRVRKLSPRECFRLMGFKDEYYEKARYFTDEEFEEIKKSKKKYSTELDELGIERAIKLSDAQTYKQAGNSIVVNVLYHVFKELNLQYPTEFNNIKVCSLFSGIGAFEQALKAIGNEDDILITL